ncbi:MAG: thioredoxin family protein [Alphaproteobacteria bacterium]|nr:thioredoxin family protein [Alphaproteobacteria bacterium]
MLRRLLLVFILSITSGLACAASPTGPIAPVKATLVPERTTMMPGRPLWVDLHLDIEHGWHVYWRNPGDSGLPTEIEWTLPAGYSAGDIVWPTPERFVVGTIGNYGYADAADLLVPLTVPADATPGGTQHLAAHATWLVCSDICIPGETVLTLDLPVAASAAPASPATTATFAAARTRLAKPASFSPSVRVGERDIRLELPASAVNGLVSPVASFFPNEPNIIDAAAEPHQQVRDGGLELILPRVGGPTAKTPQALDGVLALKSVDGMQRAYTIHAAVSPATPAVDDIGAAEVGWGEALGLAFLGGLILNLMPCVFPVLSLKLIGIAESVHRAEQRRHAFAYAGGAVLSFAALGGALLLLRGTGAVVGWGFQLQSPLVVALLAYLLFAMGLSLSGVADFGTRLIGMGDRFAHHDSTIGAFATGVLATIVATPCTAPFMGAALGFALLASAPIALSVFVALGCGLAAPIALASIVPGIARIIPGPGPWMLWLKQLLAFPLYATVAWLVWVLLQEVGPIGAFAGLLGLVAIGFAVWIYGRTRFVAASGRYIGNALACVALAAALFAGITLSATGVSAGIAATGLGYEPFSESRLAHLEAEHQPIFINLTAAWCITCLVNERATLDSSAIRDAFAQHGVVALKGDWTRQDPAITAMLQRFGRSGVPLYVLYDRQGTPTVLPQILTEDAVLAALPKG